MVKYRLFQLFVDDDDDDDDPKLWCFCSQSSGGKVVSTPKTTDPGSILGITSLCFRGGVEQPSPH